MADLENLLLEAAGRTSAAVKNQHQLPPSSKHHGGSFSDDESDSGDEDLDEGRSYARRKPSQVPLKKRFDSTERGSDEEHNDDSDNESLNSDESDVGPDLYKDDADRRRLSELTELEREMILTNRAEKKDGKKFMEKLRSKRDKPRGIQSRKETSCVPLSRGVRSSARTAEKSAALGDVLNQLREKRLKQQDSKARNHLMDTSKGSAGGQGIFPIKRKALGAASLIDSGQNEYAGGSQDEDVASTWDGESLDSDEESSQPPTYQDIKDITIPRSKLAKWFMEPFFEELIAGCFVRVGFGKSSSGPVYRLCMVQNVDASNLNRQYELEGKMTHKYLNCVLGSEHASKWQMALVSNSSPEEEEFNEWIREVKRSAGHMPSKHDVLEKRETLQKSNTFVYSATTVKQMLQEKKASARPVNIAVEKDRLRRQLEVAESKCDEVEVERIKTRLLELEASRQSQEKNSKAIRLAEMNRKNRFENFKNASGLKPINTNLKAGEAGYDPFSRRWTRSRNYYVPKPGGGDEAVVDETAEEANGTLGVTSKKAKVKVTGGFGMQATAAALEAAAGAGKLVDTSAPVDRATESYMLHNFELPISLAALHKFGGPHGAPAAYFARKQKIEATVGYHVPEDDGRRHALTLTVSDYKRRRGLL